MNFEEKRSETGLKLVRGEASFLSYDNFSKIAIAGFGAMQADETMILVTDKLEKSFDIHLPCFHKLHRWLLNYIYTKRLQKY